MMNYLWLLLPLLLIFSCCSYEKEATEWEQFSQGHPSPQDDSIVFIRKYEKFRKASGLNRFPDGGKPKYLAKELSLYRYSHADDASYHIADIVGRAGNPPVLEISWKKERFVYRLDSVYNRNRFPAVSWSTNTGIFMVETDQWRHSRIVDFGERPELSPDAKRIAFLVRTESGLESLWIKEIESGTTRALVEKAGVLFQYIRWDDNSAMLLYSRDPEKRVYRYDFATNSLTPADVPYTPPADGIRRKEVSRIFNSSQSPSDTP